MLRLDWKNFGIPQFREAVKRTHAVISLRPSELVLYFMLQALNGVQVELGRKKTSARIWLVVSLADSKSQMDDIDARTKNPADQVVEKLKEFDCESGVVSVQVRLAGGRYLFVRVVIVSMRHKKGEKKVSRNVVVQEYYRMRGRRPVSSNDIKEVLGPKLRRK